MVKINKQKKIRVKDPRGGAHGGSYQAFHSVKLNYQRPSPTPLVKKIHFNGEVFGGEVKAYAFKTSVICNLRRWQK